MSDAQPAPTTMSKEDLAFYVNAIWGSLLVPSWLRDDLIELGKAVYAKTTLAKLDDKKFAQLLPFLTKMAESLGEKLHVKVAELTQPLVDENLRLQAAITKLQAENELLRTKQRETPPQTKPIVVATVAPHNAPILVPGPEVQAFPTNATQNVAIVGTVESSPQDVAIVGVVDAPAPASPDPTPNENAAPKPPEQSNG